MVCLQMLEFVAKNVAQIFPFRFEEEMREHDRWSMPLPTAGTDRFAADHNGRWLFHIVIDARCIQERFDFKRRHPIASAQHVVQSKCTGNPTDKEDACSDEPRIEQQSSQNILGSAHRDERRRLKPGPGLNEV
jgi:hypothetical protein